MRPIDGDEFIKYFRYKATDTDYDKAWIGVIRRAIKNAPTLFTDDDAVNRQAVLDIAFKYCSDDDGACSKPDADLREMLDDIENLPQAQFVYTCNGCKHYGKWEDEIENGYNCPCIRCARRGIDNYE